MAASSMWSSDFWGRHFGPDWERGDAQVSMLAKRHLASRAKAVLLHPQARGNYFTFKEAIAILGLDSREVFREGYLTPDPEKYVDMSFMYSLQGPPQSALDAMRERLSFDTISPYPPDLLYELRNLAAEVKFRRARSPRFEVMGVEGAQGGIGYTFLSYLDPGDEVLITDPAYMHFGPGPLVEGATVRKIPLSARNGYRLHPDEVRDAISLRTRMLVVCDPLNPFGTVQRREELVEIAEICKKHDILIFNNITHSSFRTNPAAQHHPLTSLWQETDVDHVVSTTGLSKGYSLAGLRIGFLGGHPDLLKAPGTLKMEVTKIHIQLLGQYGAIAALRDHAYVEACTQRIRRNYAHLKETLERTPGVTLPVEPDYGFCLVMDVADTGVSAQELTVALFKYRVAVIPGDAFGDTGITRYVRLNYSQRDLRQLEHFREVLPVAIEDARTGRYKDDVIRFFAAKDNERARRIVRELKEGPVEPAPAV
jgi:aspartate/methionine/tyrosine aminotransferase